MNYDTFICPQAGREVSLSGPVSLLMAALSIVMAVTLMCHAGQVMAAEAPINFPSDLMTPAQLQLLPAQPADHRLAYGVEPEQFGDLRVPTGAGPHPIVMLVHGGCWKASYATLGDLAPMADALKEAGLASWNIEYRRLFQTGGGWPGTYLDVGKAADQLRTLAPQYNLDLGRVVVVGHSAGGHLALWLAARHRLDSSSELHIENPLTVNGVINLSGTMDMRLNIGNMQQACADPVVEAMNAGMPAEVPEHYAQSSAAPLLPLGTAQLLLWNAFETFVPLPLAQAYTRSALAAGDKVRLAVVPELGHFELASPHEASWPILLDGIRSMLEGRFTE